MPRHSLEVLCDVVRTRCLDMCIVGFTLCLTDRHGQSSLLLGEQVGPDLVVVVEAQQFATLGHQVLDTVTRAPSAGASAGLGGRRQRPIELPADGRLRHELANDDGRIPSWVD